MIDPTQPPLQGEEKGIKARRERAIWIEGEVLWKSCKKMHFFAHIHFFLYLCTELLLTDSTDLKC